MQGQQEAFFPTHQRASAAGSKSGGASPFLVATPNRKLQERHACMPRPPTQGSPQSEGAGIRVGMNSAHCSRRPAERRMGSAGRPGSRGGPDAQRHGRGTEAAARLFLSKPGGGRTVTSRAAAPPTPGRPQPPPRPGRDLPRNADGAGAVHFPGRKQSHGHRVARGRRRPARGESAGRLRRCSRHSSRQPGQTLGTSRRRSSPLATPPRLLIGQEAARRATSWGRRGRRAPCTAGGFRDACSPRHV